MSSKQGNSRRIARRLISLGSARLRLLFVPVLIAWALLGVGLGAVQQAQAQSRDEDSGGGVQHIVVTLYKSRTLMLQQPFASAVVGSPELVDALPMSDRRLYIQGKKVGTTNVSVFNQSMQLIGVIDVEVTLDTGNLQEKIRASTGSSAIRVGSSNGQIVLSGVAGNAVAADRAVEVAKTMVPEGNIVNAMTVAPSQQVMLRVRFLEVARSASREIGVNWNGANNAGNRGFATGLGTSSAGGRPAIGPRHRISAVGRRPVLTRAETRYPSDASGTPAGSGATWPSDIQYCGDFALWCGAFWRRAGQSRHQGGQPRRYSDRTGRRRASSDAWPSRTWLHSPVTPPPSWRAANFRCRQRNRGAPAACRSSPPTTSPSACN